MNIQIRNPAFFEQAGPEETPYRPGSKCRFDTAAQECRRWNKQELTDSLLQNNIEVFYQPKHHAQTGALLGAEALARWRHPEFGLLLPQTFTPAFEQYDLLGQLDYYMLEHVCMDLQHWQNRAISVVPVSVNTARQDFLEEDVCSRWTRMAEKYGVALKLLHIEVTEGFLGDLEKKPEHQLMRCRAAGIQVELDDFGVGYSSLSRLHTLPADAIKLDKTFADNIFSQKGAGVLKACIDMARTLNMKLIAEGVETAEQMQILRRMNCDIVQGFYFSRPLPKEEFEQYLLRYSAACE